MPTDIAVCRHDGPSSLPIEIVERKGLGHPDTIADALAERMSVGYSQYCRDRFGAVLHHNLDKLYLRGGQARTGLGVFSMEQPTILEIGGRASSSFGGVAIDSKVIFETVARDYLRVILPNFDVDNWLQIKHLTTDRSRFPTWFRPRTLDDLPELKNPVSSDTVAVTSWWPHSPTEELVLSLERYFNRSGVGPRHRHLGQDIKVLAVRKGQRIEATICIAVHPSVAMSSHDYDEVLDEVKTELENFISRVDTHGLEVDIDLNSSRRNPYGAKREYLLGSGTCLEFGEEGFVGRGNSAAGLISVSRPKSVEAAFGKNPTYHSGKVYTICADEIARRIHLALGVGATVTIVSDHSSPIREPAHVEVSLDGGADPVVTESIVLETLETIDFISCAVDQGRLIPS